MNKKIKVRLFSFENNLSKMVIEEAAEKGDYFYLEDVLKDRDSIDKQYFYDLVSKSENHYVEDLKKEYKAELKNQSIIEFKASNDYMELIKKINQLQETNKVFEDKLVNKLASQKNEYNAQTLSLKMNLENQKQEELKKLELALNQKKEEIYKLEKDHNEKLTKIKELIVEQERKAHKEVIDQFVKINSEEKEELKAEIEKLKTKISSLERKPSNIKILGKELENWVQNQYDNSALSLNSDLVLKREVVTENELSNKKGRCDFVFKCLDKKGNPSLIVGIECKTEDSATTFNKKNNNYFTQITNYGRDLNANYMVLVSELEKERDFSIIEERLENENFQLFIVRPQFLITFLTVLSKFNEVRNNLLKEKEEKELFIKDFDEVFSDFRKKVLEKTLKFIKKNLEDIKKESTKIIKAGEKIIELSEKTLNSHLAQFLKHFNKLSPKLIKFVKNSKTKIAQEDLIAFEGDFELEDELDDTELDGDAE